MAIYCHGCQSLFDEVKRLEAQIENPWIDARKQLPKTQKGSSFWDYRTGFFGRPWVPVLFVSGGETCAGRYFGPKRGFVSLQGVFFQTNRVRWWQPMPEPPKKTKSGLTSKVN